MELLMNRNLWTMVQLAASAFNAAFMVLSHLAHPVAESSVTGVAACQTAYRHEVVLAEPDRSVDSFSGLIGRAP
jgi:hypothetical protein